MTDPTPQFRPISKGQPDMANPNWVTCHPGGTTFAIIINTDFPDGEAAARAAANKITEQIDWGDGNSSSFLLVRCHRPDDVDFRSAPTHLASWEFEPGEQSDPVPATLLADFVTIYPDDVAGSDVPADRWFYETSDRWVAVAPYTDESDWFDTETQHDGSPWPVPRTYPIDQRPPSGLLIYKLADGSEVSEPANATDPVRVARPSSAIQSA